MGKGDKLTQGSILAVQLMQEKLASIEEISTKRMFGGHGIFKDGKMFCIVDSKGHYYLKVNETNKEDFENAGAKKHVKMPYYLIPEEIFSNHEMLILWAKKSMNIS